MRNLYRIAWGALAFIGQRWVAWGGGLAFVVLYASTYDQPLNALPYLMLWALFVGGCQMVLRVLPVPRSGDSGRSDALPAPQIAVSVAPHMACRADLATMTAAMPHSLRRLLPADATEKEDD